MKKQRHIIIFNETEVENCTAVAMSEMGRGTKLIMERTGLTPCQVSHRLFKSKTAEGLPKGTTYRTQWRDGTSDVARMADEVMLDPLIRDVSKRLPQKFAHVVKFAGDRRKKKQRKYFD